MQGGGFAMGTGCRKQHTRGGKYPAYESCRMVSLSGGGLVDSWTVAVGGRTDVVSYDAAGIGVKSPDARNIPRGRIRVEGIIYFIPAKGYLIP